MAKHLEGWHGASPSFSFSEFEADFCTDVGTLETHNVPILASSHIGGATVREHSVGFLRPNQPTGQCVGLSVPCTMHARHAGICDSCGQRRDIRSVLATGKEGQVERSSSD